MPQVATTSIGSIRPGKTGGFELLSPTGGVMFSGKTPEEAQEFARSLQMPVREGAAPSPQPSVTPSLPSGGPSGGLSIFGAPSGPPGTPQPNVGASVAPIAGGLQPPPGVSPITAGRAQLPGPSEFTNLLKKVVDVKLGRRPFIIGIPDEDMQLLTPSAVRGELGRRADDLLRQGADVSAIMDSYRGMYQDTLTVADKYLQDMQSRQKMLSEMAFSEPMLTRGVLPEALKSVLSPEEQAMWGEMSTFYKEQFAKGKVPQPYGNYLDEQTGKLTILFRDPVSGEITTKVISGVTEGGKTERELVQSFIQKYPDAGITLTDTLAQAQAKLSKSRIYRQATRLAGGGGRGGGDTVPTPSAPGIPSIPSAPPPRQTWEEFLAQEQERRGMTIDPRSSLYKQLRTQFDAQQETVGVPIGSMGVNILTAQLGKMVYGTRVSDKESERIADILTEYQRQRPDAGVTEIRQDLMQRLLGYEVKKNAEIGDQLLNAIIQFRDEDGLAGFDVAGLAKLLNADKVQQAITKVENAAMLTAKKLDPDGYLGEPAALRTVQLADQLRGYITSLGKDSPVGVTEGTFQGWLGRLKGKRATKVKADITALVAEWRKQYAGVNVTESELRFVSDLAPSLFDRPDNFMAKLDSLENQVLTKFNAARTTVGLPEITSGQLTNKAARVGSYGGMSVVGMTTFTSKSGKTYTIPNF